jgi:DNA-binding LacI/PurR family transcriptional regulator
VRFIPGLAEANSTIAWFFKIINRILFGVNRIGLFFTAKFVQGRAAMGIDLNNPVPLYQQIVEILKREISSGQHKEGDLIGSQEALAQRFGVSLITARKAMAVLINQGYLIGRVGKGMYVARRLRSVDYAKIRTLGLVLSDLRNPFFSMIIPGVESAASERGYNLLLSDSSGQIEKEESQITHFMDIGVDGLIIASMTHRYQVTAAMKKLVKAALPFVMVSYIDNPDIPYVGTDHEKGAYLATEHLIKQGFQRIGFISAEKGNLVAFKRQRGYERALREYGYDSTADDVFYMKWNNMESGYEIAEQIFARPVWPEAFFVYSDISALGFQKAALERGIQIPDELALVGYDNIERSSYAPVPLTTIHQPAFEIGQLAVDKVIKLIEGRPVEVRTTLEPKLIIRDSCGAARKQA